MRPAEWEDWTDTVREHYARGLLHTPRGEYLISQALAFAIEILADLEPLEGEVLSVVEDMEMLQESIFYRRVASPILTGDYLSREIERVVAEGPPRLGSQ
jgi:hypothetical protein